MANSENVRHANRLLNDPEATSVKPNTSRFSTRLSATSENESLSLRTKILEEFVEKQNARIKQLQDKTEILEEQALLHTNQIKNLEDTIRKLQHRDSDGQPETSAVSNHATQETENQMHVIVGLEEQDKYSVLLSAKISTDGMSSQIKSEDVNLMNLPIDAFSESEEIDVKTLQLLKPKDNDEKDETSSTTSKPTTNNSLQFRPTVSYKFNHVKKDQNTGKFTESGRGTNESTSNREHSSLSSSRNYVYDRSHTALMESEKDFSDKERWFGCTYDAFVRWMDSRDEHCSLWTNREYRDPLLAYIGKMYGQKKNVRCVMEPLKLEYNYSNELDQLYVVIKEFEKQPDAKRSLQEWQSQIRPDHRLVEIKAMFEFSSTYPSTLGGLQISSPFNAEKIISCGSIKACFDMICRDGLIGADIGEYLHLEKNNIFGGDESDPHNERMTFVNVRLNESNIDLADNRVDLITCLATLHHVPHIDPMLSELVRILRPGGYLIVREHSCKRERSLTAKYLNFIHAFMMIARVGEFAHVSTDRISKVPGGSIRDSGSDATDWEQLKSSIIENTSSIQYRTQDEWHQKLKYAGFRFIATLDYDTNTLGNPQAIYYAVYQLNTK